MKKQQNVKITGISLLLLIFMIFSGSKIQENPVYIESVYKVGKMFNRTCVCSEGSICKARAVRKRGVYQS